MWVCQHLENGGNPLKYSEKPFCKGFSRFSMNNITFQDYMSCLERQEAKYVTEYWIVSKNRILTTKFIKKALSGFDDKRYILDCGIHSEHFAEINNEECHDPECMVQEQVFFENQKYGRIFEMPLYIDQPLNILLFYLRL